MKEKLRALAAALVLAVILGGIALVVGGLLIALAIAIPALIILAILFGKPARGIRIKLKS